MIIGHWKRLAFCLYVVLCAVNSRTADKQIKINLVGYIENISQHVLNLTEKIE